MTLERGCRVVSIRREEGEEVYCTSPVSRIFWFRRTRGEEMSRLATVDAEFILGTLFVFHLGQISPFPAALVLPRLMAERGVRCCRRGKCSCSLGAGLSDL